jgi:hypothetical protein
VIEQVDHRGGHAVVGEPAYPKVTIDPLADCREDLSERHQLVELRGVSMRAELIVIAVLLPSASVAAGRLDVRVRIGGYPDVDPRRWC